MMVDEVLEMETVHDLVAMERASILALLVCAGAWWALDVELIGVAIGLGFVASASLAFAAKAYLDFNRHERMRHGYFRGERP